MLTLLLDIFFPPLCVSCHTLGTYLCENCLSHMKQLVDKQHIDLKNPVLDELYASTSYKDSGKELIKIVKFGQAFSLIKTMVFLILQSIDKPEVDLITFTPLHWQREQERGFNQAETMANLLGKYWNLPVHKTIKKSSHTTPQAELGRKERLTHLRHAFEYINAGELEGKTVAIIDDVATTGTTLNECAKILKGHGAKKVIGIVFAHGK